MIVFDEDATLLARVFNDLKDTGCSENGHLGLGVVLDGKES